MKQRFSLFFGACAAIALILGRAEVVRAQVTPAEGYTPPDDTPTVKVGGTIYADYTYQLLPTSKDSDGNVIHPNAFNLTRAYINVTGNISHWISFRITPDVVRVGQVTSGDNKPVDVPGLSGTLTYRLKYAYGQINFDDFAPKGTWLRLGMQPTPFVNFEEDIYRYRFQGTIFSDREGFLSSSDLGGGIRFVFPENFGDIQAGVYNGETYTRAEANDQKAIQIRATVRPVPMLPVIKGLRLTGFYDHDRYVRDAKRDRGIVMLTFEHPYLNLGAQILKAKDQNASATKAVVTAEGYSIWATPRTPIGIEALLRYDYLRPNTATRQRKDRLIGGIAYWFPVQKGVAAALLLDYEQVRYRNFTPARLEEERYALHTLFNF